MPSSRGSSNDTSRVAKLVFKQKPRQARDRSVDHNSSLKSNPLSVLGTPTLNLDSCFPIDVAYKTNIANSRHIMYRVDIQEYQIEEANLKPFLSQIISDNGEDKNFLIFTFDLSNPSSFKLYLKKAIRELIFAFEDMNDSLKKR